MSDLRTFKIDDIVINLAKEYTQEVNWLGNELALYQLQAAWLRLAEDDYPMNPRLIGKPGVGKTTLAIAVAKTLGKPVYMMQGTTDTRPDDLIITPILGEDKKIIYTASPLVTAMVKGGVCILDEGNRMSEKSWASLAALLDHRRYVDSIVAGIRIYAHKEFRFVTTMNDDSSVFDLPEYIQSRLNPQIYLDLADEETQERIIRYSVPYLEEELLQLLVQFLTAAHKFDESCTVRDGIQIAKYAQRLKTMNPSLNISDALRAGVFSILGEEALRFLTVTRPHLKPRV